MSRIASKPQLLSKARARRIWLHAQRLDTAMPFGDGPEATRAAVEHLGYVQIDTINVIERCHHHILFTRIPGYQRAHLRQAQSIDKTVFEYWTHALSYVPTRDMRFFLGAMRRYRHSPSPWFTAVAKRDLRKVLTLIRKDGPLTIRDIDDDVLVEKEHPWASRKPSKRALQVAFYTGVLTVSSPEKKASCSARFDGLRLAQGWSFSTSTSSSMSRIDRAPSLRINARTLRKSSFFTESNQLFGVSL